GTLTPREATEPGAIRCCSRSARPSKCGWRAGEKRTAAPGQPSRVGFRRWRKKDLPVSKEHQPDPIRLAAAVHAEELAAGATRLAPRLRSGEALPPAAVARTLIDANRFLARLQRHECRLQPPRRDT